MDVGKGVPNHYKSEFEFSNFISFLYLFCAYIIVWKKILKNPIHALPPFLGIYVGVSHGPESLDHLKEKA